MPPIYKDFQSKNQLRNNIILPSRCKVRILSPPSLDNRTYVRYNEAAHCKSNETGGDTRKLPIHALAKAETASSGYKRRAAAAEKPFERIRDVPCVGDLEILQKRRRQAVLRRMAEKASGISGTGKTFCLSKTKKHRYGLSVSVLIRSQRNTRTAKPVPKK